MRNRMFLMALAGFGGMLLMMASAKTQQPVAAPPPANQPVQSFTRPTVAVFNMAYVMREYGKAKYQVYLLQEEKKKLSVDLVELRGRTMKLNSDMQQVQDPKMKEQLAIQQRELVRQYEDKERDVNKQLNEKSSVIISQLYDEIKSVVDKTAETNGYHIVFAYPDATTPEEMKSTYIKELKLKPPAAQPFYVARQVDISGVVIQTLNLWYPSPPVPTQPPVQNQQGNPLPGPGPGPATGPAPGPAPGRP
jgi:Skp family chaperone for outer membrane proteins